MAEFKRSYDLSEKMEGESTMTDAITGSGMGPDFVGGLLVGGLAGWAFSRNQNGCYPVNNACSCGCNGGQYSIADVSNLVATKDAQYAQLNATQQSEFNVLSQLYKDNTTLASAICNLGYENAMLNNSTQRQIADASAKADLCCCKTQGLIEKTSCETQGMIGQIVPQLQNFYLADEVE